jgi:hypothetical protein
LGSQIPRNFSIYLIFYRSEQDEKERKIEKETERQRKKEKERKKETESETEKPQAAFIVVIFKNFTFYLIFES